jgi:hypothetical protein
MAELLDHRHRVRPQIHRPVLPTCSRTVHGVTVTIVEPGIPPKVAVILVAPGCLGSNRPLVTVDELLRMCATVSFDEVQSTCDVTFWIVPSEKKTVAVICSVVPLAKLGLAVRPFTRRELELLHEQLRREPELRAGARSPNKLGDNSE